MFNEINLASKMFALEIVASEALNSIEFPLISLLINIRDGSGSSFDRNLVEYAKQRYLIKECDGELKLDSRGREIIKELEQSENMLRDDCVKWLSEKLNLGLINSREKWERFEKWLNVRNLSELIQILGHLPKKIPKWMKPAEDILVAVTDCQMNESEPCPILRRLYLEWIGKTLDKVDAKGAICIILDTNILLDLTTPGRRRNELALSTWERLSSYVRKGQVNLYICARTLAELKRVIAASGDTVMRLHLKRLSGKSLTNEDVATLQPLEQQFLVNKQGPTLLDFTDSKISQVRTLKGLQNVAEGWSVRGLDDLKLINIKEIEDVVCDIRANRYFPMRTWDADVHDISIITLANKMNAETKSGESWVVWTHHGRLAEFADAMELRDPVVSFGPNICLMLEKEQAKSNIESLRKIYRDCMLAQFYIEEAKDLNKIRNDLQMHWIRLTGYSLPKESGDNRPTGKLLDIEDGEMVRVETPPKWEHLIGQSINYSQDINLPKSFVLQNLDDNQWFDITMDIGYCPGGHGVEPPRIEYNARQIQRWFIPVHGVTHMDLPWAVDLKDARLSKSSNLPELTDAEAQSLRRRLTSTRCADAIVVNLTHLREKIENCLIEDHLAGYKIDPKLSGENLAKLIIELAIDENTLKQRIHDITDMKDKVLILHTGWAASYLPKSKDLSRLTYEISHPWLVHPWITAKAADMIVKMGVAAVATDCPMLDCPFYIGGVIGDKPAIKEAHDIVFKTRFDATKEFKGLILEELQPMHAKSLPKGITLYENLFIPDEICSAWYKNSKAFMTKIVLNFLDFALLMDGAICKFFIKSPEE